MTRVYVCSCFGITEQQVKQHAVDGRCTPRQIASACKAGTDCGSCVKRIQGLLGRGAAPARTAPAAAQRLAAMPAAVAEPERVVAETGIAAEAEAA
ncbi:BFD-like [2Fe-2S] binding domain-containing protein [Actinacidiphila alni]|uniref:Bacterioferritin-associated ferredoxin n=1 Tax=Actinacidiphila alni TaxID=380248 RepID=A0A1I2GTV6_9ACTN|nr:(2Fe-2S)-binding protein [Actinacidiphila alni]SFF20678.1 BFD-like [2Fe-2S] binding domain-containing protein [Actinacidiphila alni]